MCYLWLSMRLRAFNHVLAGIPLKLEPLPRRAGDGPDRVKADLVPCLRTAVIHYASTWRPSLRTGSSSSSQAELISSVPDPQRISMPSLGSSSGAVDQKISRRVGAFRGDHDFTVRLWLALSIRAAVFEWSDLCAFSAPR